MGKADCGVSPANAQSLTSLAAGRVLPIVANYYALIPTSARQAFSEILDRVGKPTASSNETYCLTNNINNVISYDPAFAVEIYQRVFSYEETSQDTVPMGGSGPVISFSSTRAQEYSMSYYILDQKYPRLLKRDLVLAARAAALAITAEVTRTEGETIRKLGLYKTTFPFLGTEVTLESDRSEIWDQSHRSSHALQLLSRFLNHVREMFSSGKLTRNQVDDALENSQRTVSMPLSGNTCSISDGFTTDFCLCVLNCCKRPSFSAQSKRRWWPEMLSRRYSAQTNMTRLLAMQ